MVPKSSLPGKNIFLHLCIWLLIGSNTVTWSKKFRLLPTDSDVHYIRFWCPLIMYFSWCSNDKSLQFCIKLCKLKGKMDDVTTYIAGKTLLGRAGAEGVLTGERWRISPFSICLISGNCPAWIIMSVNNCVHDTHARWCICCCSL